MANVYGNTGVSIAFVLRTTDVARNVIIIQIIKYLSMNNYYYLLMHCVYIPFKMSRAPKSKILQIINMCSSITRNEKCEVIVKLLIATLC